jgi:hypothetical protein
MGEKLTVAMSSSLETFVCVLRDNGGIFVIDGLADDVDITGGYQH